YGNAAINGWHLTYTILLYASFLSFGGDILVDNFAQKAGQVKIMTLVIVTFFVLGHVHDFGQKQFKLFPRTVGGGRPDIGILRTSLTNQSMMSVVGIPCTNGLVGPICIL